MKAKDKAKELVERFRILATSRGEDDGYCEATRSKASKQCALICVDLILKAVTTIADKRFDFYTEVKKEIEKL